MWHFDRQTIEILVRIVSPDISEAARVARAADRDPALLCRILQEPRLHGWLFERPHEMVSVSPHAFFAALLYRVRRDLATQSFSRERDSGRMVIVFDVEQTRELLEADEVLAYLSWVLASFVRIHTITRRVRVRPSVWRTCTVSDYDLGSLLGYVRRLEPDRRPVIYRRIAEAALFQSGVFSDVPGQEDLVRVGIDAYRRALSGGVMPEETEVIETVRDAFRPASKAFTFMADHYLGSLRTKVFTFGR